MRFKMLGGPIEIEHASRSLPAGSVKEQYVMAILLMDAGRTVALSSIAERLWGDKVPNNAKGNIQSYVSRLRGRIGKAGGDGRRVIAGASGGYRLNVSADDIDAKKFELLFHRARAARKGDPSRARGLLQEAESLWRGDPIASMAGQWADTTRQQLAELKHAAALLRIELDLELGTPAEDLVSELTVLAGAAHTDEKVVSLLMSALATAGRTEDALAAFQTARSRLVERGLRPGQELHVSHQRILSGNPLPQTPAVARSPAKPPDILDRDLRHLAGRDVDLEELLARVADDLRSGSGPVLYALDGMPGIGKTALAVRAAHLLGPRCPDGWLQINLRTYRPQHRVGAREALKQLLHVTRAPAADIERADSVDGLATLWRHHTSRRRVLLVLDDVADAEQVEPLIPTSAGSIVLLTSRRSLSGLPGLRQHTMGTLSDTAVREMLATIVSRELPDLAGGLDQFTRHCGGLPLAVSVAAAFLNKHPTWTLTDLNHRLSVSRLGSGGDELSAQVHAAFSMSFVALPRQLQTLLCLVAAHPGPDIEPLAAAALAGLGPGVATLALENLKEHCLIEETGPNRYRLHDLLREYALAQTAGLLGPDDVEAALRRLLDAYVASVTAADRAIRPHRSATSGALGGVAHPGFPSPGDARAWLDAEQANLRAVNTLAHERGWHRQAVMVPMVLAEHLDRRGEWRSAVGILHRALDARAAEGPAEPGDTTTARLLTDLAAAHIRVDELDEALDYAERALDTWTRAGNRHGLADTWLQIGRLHKRARRPHQAITALKEAVALYAELGELERLATAEDHLSTQLFDLGHHSEAFALGWHVVETAREIGDPALVCDVLTNLGERYSVAGQPRQALVHFRQAAELLGASADPQNAAVLANNIGAAHAALGEYAIAKASYHKALELHEGLDDPGNQTDVMINLAEAHTNCGDHPAALEQLSKAFRLVAALRDPLRHSRIHRVTGDTHRNQGRLDDALASYRIAVEQADRAEAPMDQARALRAIGDVLRLRQDPEADRYTLQADLLEQRLNTPAAVPPPTA